MSDLKVGDIVEHVHSDGCDTCPREGAIGVIRAIASVGVYDVVWIVEGRGPHKEHGSSYTIVKEDLVLRRSEP